MNDPEIQAAQVAAVKVIRKQAGDLLGRARIALSDPPVGSSRRPEADPGPAVDLSWEDFLVRTRATEVMAWCRAKAKKATCLPVRWRDEHAGDWEWGLCPRVRARRSRETCGDSGSLTSSTTTVLPTCCAVCPPVPPSLGRLPH